MTEMKAEKIEQKARDHLAPFGFVVFGWFREEGGKPALLIGNVGSSIWEPFKRSDEYADGQADPLNRWTATCIKPLAATLSAQSRYPFGETVWPFQNYARDATGMQQSPIGLFIHPKYGLWTAFRAVLVFDSEFQFAPPSNDPHPCDTCVDKPCLTSCPIDAFTTDGYDYMACKTFVRSDESVACRTKGCFARNACPVGRNYANELDHQAFHMGAYV